MASAAHVLFTLTLNIDRIERRSTTYDANVFAVRSGKVAIDRLLPPLFPKISTYFTFLADPNQKRHKHCPGGGRCNYAHETTFDAEAQTQAIEELVLVQSLSPTALLRPSLSRPSSPTLRFSSTCPISYNNYVYFQTMTPDVRPVAIGRLGRSPFTSSNILYRVLSCSLTGRRLGLHVYNHLGHRLHVLCIARTRMGSSGGLVQCFERRYIFSTDMEDVRREMDTRPVEGVCTCMWDDQPWDLLIHLLFRPHYILTSSGKLHLTFTVKPFCTGGSKREDGTECHKVLLMLKAKRNVNTSMAQ
jgi:hypothetical protein